MNKNIKGDSKEIVLRLEERNPNFIKLIQDKIISLEDFTEIVITQYLAFNNLKEQEEQIIHILR